MFNGIEFDVASQLDPATRLGWSVIFSGFHGRKWNWHRMDFEKDS